MEGTSDKTAKVQEKAYGKANILSGCNPVYIDPAHRDTASTNGLRISRD